MRRLALLFVLVCAIPAHASVHLDRVTLPPGFVITVLARVPGARAMTLGAHGTLFVGSLSDKVFAVDAKGRVQVVAQGLQMPNGVAFRGGTLYIADVSTVLALDGIEDNLARPPAPRVVTRLYPKDKHHGRKFIAFGPDGWLYVPQGAPCNVCDEGDPYGTITRLSVDGTRREIFARGVRNTVGFAWHPVTGALWFTDNGRDLLGDDTPPDELNTAPTAGLHFGFPHCHGLDVVDPEFPRGPCSAYVPPEQVLGAHVASLGMRFYTGPTFPARYRQQIFIAEHGSWNRRNPSGYRITVVTLGDDGHARGYEPFAEGWLGRNGEAWGRPVDVQVAPDGALLVSDDRAGVIYRIAHSVP